MSLSETPAAEDAVDVAPASPAQRALWLLDRYRGGQGLLSVPIVLRLRGPLDVAALEAALNATVAHHESLRTTVEMRRRSLVQVIHPVGATPVTIDRHLGADLPFDAAYDQTRSMLQSEPDVRGVPLRASLWRLGEDDHLFALNVHHLVTDAWSNRLVLDALGAAYSGLVLGQPAELPPVSVRYADYARSAAVTSTEESQQFWADSLRDARFARIPPLPAGRPGAGVFRTRQPRPPAAHEPVDLEPETLSRLRQVGREQRATLFMLLLGAYMYALASITGQDDLAVGSIFSNRAQPRLHGTVGFFANLTVLRTRLAASALATAAELRRPVLLALSHQHLHHGTLPLSTGDQVTSGGPGDAVFHMLSLPPGTTGCERIFARVDAEELRWPDQLASRFELELVLAPRGERMSGTFRYAADRFDPEWVRDLRTRFTEAVGAMTR
jgi:hypothetical protein